MSDFAGLWRLDGQPVSDRDLSRLAAGLEGKGIRPPRRWMSGTLGIVHRQHCFTPEDSFERMPLTGPSGKVLAADCLLNEREGLRALTGVSSGAMPPDGSLLLAALESRGKEVLPSVYGRFTFALWDPAEQQLMLARDAGNVGGASLFYYHSDHLFAFSTRLRPLLSLPDIPQELDEEMLARHLVLDPSIPEKTFYRHISRLPAAHVAVVGRQSWRCERHWFFPLPESRRIRNDRECEEQAREILDRAVGDALRSQGPVTACLTSGLDSTAVAESASRQTPAGRLMAVTIVPGGEVPPDGAYCHNESLHVPAIAEVIPGLRWFALPGQVPGSIDYERVSRRYCLEAGGPSRAQLNMEWFVPIYDFMQQQGSQVLLDGAYGNLFFSSSGLEFLPGMLTGGRWLVEFFGTLPARQFLRNGVTRRLARRLLEGRLPDFVVHSQIPRGMQGGDWFARLTPLRASMEDEVSRLKQNPLARRLVDLDRLGRLLEKDGWPADTAGAERHRGALLQLLTRGLDMARFLAWHSGGNGGPQEPSP